MSFRVAEVIFEGRRVPLSMHDGSVNMSDNYFTIIIGRNGTGKSRMLAEICRAFNSFDSNTVKSQISKRAVKNSNYISSKNLEIGYYNDGRQHHLYFTRKGSKYVVYKEQDSFFNEQSCLPHRVIATTITPSDKFPIGRRHRSQPSSIGQESESIYRYLGSKNNFGQISSTGQLSRVIESLMFASEKSTVELAGMNHVFELLGYKSRIVVDYLVKFSSDVRRQLEEFDYSADNPIEFFELFGMNTRSSYLLEQESNRNYNFKNELLEAIKAIVDSGLNGRICTIEIDLESEFFISGSLELFKSILFLRKYGLITLSDLRVIKSATNVDVSIREASSGEQAVVMTVLGIASEIENNSLIIIDEPEISLHPEWQEKFIDLLVRTFSGYHGCHFILATHSPLLLSKVNGDLCSVITMDDLTIKPAKEFSNKSADFQLAEAFGTPGYRNEYLAREGLAALMLASHRKYESAEFKEKMELLSRLRPQLHDDDPVAQMTDALVNAANEMQI